MGRAGSGRSSGHHFSSGHHISRSSGGHRVGSSRAGSSSHSSYNHSSYHSPYSYHRSYGTSIYVGSGSHLSGIIAFCIFLFILINLIFVISASSGNKVSSTIERTKIESGNSYINDCIIDELGWFDNVSNTETRLKYFWGETGVQPYIYLKAYDASLVTDSQKEDWALNYYNEVFDTENVFLFVYFAERNTDEDVGYMCYVNGLQTGEVMDSEAIEIFWNYIDSYWYSDMSTDDMFVKVFTKEADTIMKVSTTSKDIVKICIIAFTVIFVAIILIISIVLIIKRKREKAAEDQRILETPINESILKDTDSTSSKYL